MLTAFGPRQDGCGEHPLLVVGAHQHGLPDQPPGDGVDVTVEGNAERLGHGAAIEVVGIEEGLGNWLELLSLLVFEDERGDLAGFLVDAIVGDVVAPCGRLRVEFEEIGEVPPRPRAAAYEADRALDARFLRRPPRCARPRRKAARTRGNAG